MIGVLASTVGSLHQALPVGREERAEPVPDSGQPPRDGGASDGPIPSLARDLVEVLDGLVEEVGDLPDIVSGDRCRIPGSAARFIEG